MEADSSHNEEQHVLVSMAQKNARIIHETPQKSMKSFTKTKIQKSWDCFNEDSIAWKITTKQLAIIVQIVSILG